MAENQGFKSLNFIIEKERNYFPWCQSGRSVPPTKNRRLKKTKIQNINTKTTGQKIFIMRIFITMRIFTRNNCMGY